jgi:hypothetical protein
MMGRHEEEMINGLEIPYARHSPEGLRGRTETPNAHV